MRRIPGLLAVLSACQLLSACAGMLIGTQSWFEQHGSGRATLAKRASFDLSCPEDKLQFAGLGQGSMSHESVGVTGCEKKAVYVFIDNSKWVLNSDGRPAK